MGARRVSVVSNLERQSKAVGSNRRETRTKGSRHPQGRGRLGEDVKRASLASARLDLRARIERSNSMLGGPNFFLKAELVRQKPPHRPRGTAKRRPCSLAACSASDARAQPLAILEILAGDLTLLIPVPSRSRSLAQGQSRAPRGPPPLYPVLVLSASGPLPRALG